MARRMARRMAPRMARGALMNWGHVVKYQGCRLSLNFWKNLTHSTQGGNT